jgi:hypothetical protein
MSDDGRNEQDTEAVEKQPAHPDHADRAVHPHSRVTTDSRRLAGERTDGVRTDADLASIRAELEEVRAERRVESPEGEFVDFLDNTLTNHPLTETPTRIDARGNTVVAQLATRKKVEAGYIDNVIIKIFDKASLSDVYRVSNGSRVTEVKVKDGKITVTREYVHRLGNGRIEKGQEDIHKPSPVRSDVLESEQRLLNLWLKGVTKLDNPELVEDLINFGEITDESTAKGAETPAEPEEEMPPLPDGLGHKFGEELYWGNLRKYKKLRNGYIGASSIRPGQAEKDPYVQARMRQLLKEKLGKSIRAYERERKKFVDEGFGTQEEIDALILPHN